jgi:hypothetical protein
MALRAIWQFMDRDVTHKIFYAKLIKEVQLTLLLYDRMQKLTFLYR